MKKIPRKVIESIYQDIQDEDEWWGCSASEDEDRKLYLCPIENIARYLKIDVQYACKQNCISVEKELGLQKGALTVYNNNGTGFIGCPCMREDLCNYADINTEQYTNIITKTIGTSCDDIMME